MGALALQGRGGRPEDFGIVLDLGPQKTVHLPAGVYSLRATSSSSGAEHFLRHRHSELWADPKADQVTELYAFDASFVLVPGLLGYGSSLRSSNYPLDFVRQQDSKLFIGEYDGSNALRADATFELRSAADDGSEFAKAIGGFAGEGAVANNLICLMLASCPGKYLRVDKNNRAVLDKFDIFNQAAYHFLPVAGLALEWASDLGEPVVFDQVAVDVRKSSGDDSRQMQLPGSDTSAELGCENAMPASAPEALLVDMECPAPDPQAAFPDPAPCPPSCEDENFDFWALPCLRPAIVQSADLPAQQPRRAPPELAARPEDAVAASMRPATCSAAHADSAGLHATELHKRSPVLEFEVVD